MTKVSYKSCLFQYQFQSSLQLLEKDPTNRIKLADVKAHPFFEDMYVIALVFNFHNTADLSVAEIGLWCSSVAWPVSKRT